MWLLLEKIELWLKFFHIPDFFIFFAVEFTCKIYHRSVIGFSSVNPHANNK